MMDDGTKLKGEITMVISPGEDWQGSVNKEAKGMGFDMKKDA